MNNEQENYAVRKAEIEPGFLEVTGDWYDWADTRMWAEIMELERLNRRYQAEATITHRKIWGLR